MTYVGVANSLPPRRSVVPVVLLGVVLSLDLRTLAGLYGSYGSCCR